MNKEGPTTGYVVSFITPDTERTFSVHLGAAVELAKELKVTAPAVAKRIRKLEKARYIVKYSIFVNLYIFFTRNSDC